MDLLRDFAAAQKSISEALVDTTRVASRIAAQDVAFHRSFDPTIGQNLDEKSARLLSLTEKLLRRSAASIANPALRLTDVEAIDTNWKGIVDVADSLFERADTCLDEFTGLVKRGELTNDHNHSPAPRVQPRRGFNAFRNLDVAKPQLLFDTSPQNFVSQPFRPFIDAKPHHIQPLENSLQAIQDADGHNHFPHPYQSEIDQYEFPSFVYSQADPIPYKPFDNTTATLVDDYEGVLELLEELKTAKEIAIDLEHHDTHSYIGLVSLMQISTRDRDWIVDTLKPWRRKLQILNQVFADPSILKVLHGSHMDMIWLQRDLGLYVVGLFDTHHASRVLGYAGGSLAFLLKKFIDFDAQKQYQTADWRLRPLPQEMFDYARSDTHFLLYIYDQMRNELISRSDFNDPEADGIAEVLRRSKEYASQRYEHPFYVDTLQPKGNGWFALLVKSPTEISKEQIATFAKVHKWRDDVAREEDEGLATVMAPHTIFSIAKTMPNDKATLLAVSHPISNIIRARADELLTVIRNAIAGADMNPEVTKLVTDGFARYKPIRKHLANSTQPSTPNATQDLKDMQMRCETSRFWGPTLISLPTDASPALALQTDLHHLILSTPQTANITPDTTKPSSEPTPMQDLPQENIDKTYNGLGKRKASATSSSASAEPTAIPTLAHRSARKAARAARKAAQQTLVPSIASSAKPLAPVDYESAPSMLHANASVKPTREQLKGRKAAFNPYLKAMDGEEGLKKPRLEGTGRSRTFKD